MQENIKLTREQVIFLAFMGVLGDMVYTHTWIDNDTDRAAWVAGFVGILLIIPLAVWLVYLGKDNPDSTIFDIIESSLGKFTSIPLIIIFILINVAISVAQLDMFTAMINTFFLQYTPPWIIILFITLICLMFVNGGILSFARLVELLTLVGCLNYFTTFIFVYPKFFHIEYIIPIFDISWIGFFKGVIFMTGCASECLLLLMIIVRFIPNPAKHYLWVVVGIIFSAVIFSFAIFIIIAMMGSELAKRIAFGGVNAAKLIEMGEFIQGLEIFIFGTYQFIAIGKVFMCMYCIWSALIKMFNYRIPRILLGISSLMIYIPSVWLASYNRAYYLAVAVEGYILLPFSLLILVLASLSIKVKKRKEERDKKVESCNSQ